METRDAGGLAHSWQGTELWSCANRRRSREKAQPGTAGRGSVPVQPRQGGAESATAAQQRRHFATSRVSGKEQRLRKAREAGTPTAAHPSPFPASQPGAARNFGGTEETSPQSRHTVSSELRPFTFPAEMSGLLPSGGSGGDKLDDCRCSTRCLTNPGSGK